ncbi:MAG: hypothetical protein H6867_07095 [Rhodospirillales bacterium]|nr:hypothetical protein [Rhodospirillales bacterium]MCB9995316.1 hypothetical protein [Rhodospirillales bacterium]
MLKDYTAFILTKEARQALIDRFPPAYPVVKANHITHRYGADGFGDLFQPKKIEVVGMVDDGNGLQALIVTVNGEQSRPDGWPYHITWSLDPDKEVPDQYTFEGRYESVHSNDLVTWALRLPGHRYEHEKVIPPIEIQTVPALVTRNQDGKTSVKKLGAQTALTAVPAPKPE